MVVYVVGFSYWGDLTLVGAFDDLARAQQAAEDFNQRGRALTMDETWTVEGAIPPTHYRYAEDAEDVFFVVYVLELNKPL
jgi:hypothetical protein